MQDSFHRILVLDWSAAGRPVRGANSIWIGGCDGSLRNAATRQHAWHLLRRDLACAARQGHRVLICADFAFGFPQGLAKQVAGDVAPGIPPALALWDHLARHHRDDRRNVSNYRDLAAAMNAMLEGPVFWGNNRRMQIVDLPRLRPLPHPALPSHRLTEGIGADATIDGTARFGPRPKSPFQLAGTGAVGAQSLTGIAWLSRLRRRPGAAVWPFQLWRGAAVVLAEVYPSMIDACWRGLAGRFACKDAGQVAMLAACLRQLDRSGNLADMLDHPVLPPSVLAAEGQILGFGHAARLRAAADQVAVGIAARSGCDLPTQTATGS